MLLELLFNFIVGVVTFLVDLIPDVKISSDFEKGMQSVSDFTSTFAYFLPIKSLVTCVILILMLDNIKFLISIFNFIIRKIPTIN